MEKENTSPCHTFILGGARSGKSRYALSLAEREVKEPTRHPSCLFVATAAIYDKEMQDRVNAHKLERGPQWHTLEEQTALGTALSSNIASFDVAVIDCLGMWVTNLLLNNPQKIDLEIESLENALKTSPKPVIMVSNEVGLGIVPENKLARRFRDVLGSVNQRFALLSSRVIFMAAGIPLVLKGSQP